MRRCLADGGISPDDVDYINAHGTSTPQGDIAETKAVKAVFGEQARKLVFGSTKSMTGHLLGAAGALEFAISPVVVRAGRIPPTINQFDARSGVRSRLRPEPDGRAAGGRGALEFVRLRGAQCDPGGAALRGVSPSRVRQDGPGPLAGVFFVLAQGASASQGRQKASTTIDATEAMASSRMSTLGSPPICGAPEGSAASWRGSA